MEEKIDQIKADLEEYNTNKDAIENLEKLLKDKKSLEKKIKTQEADYNTCEAEYIHLHTVAGQLQQKLEDK